MDAQKNHLIEEVLLTTHNKCFGSEIRKVTGDMFFSLAYFIYILSNKKFVSYLGPDPEANSISFINSCSGLYTAEIDIMKDNSVSVLQ